MSKESYTYNRNRMHTFSRAPLAEGQMHLDQASVRAGHTVLSEDVRVQHIPQIISVEERDASYLVKDTKGNFVVGGNLGASFTDVIKFIDKGMIKVLPNSNNESYNVVDEDHDPILNWIAPSDAPIAQNILSEGYDIKLFAENGEEIQRNYGWDFDTFNGILHFANDFKPGSEKWEAAGFGVPTVQGFIYIGKTLSKMEEDLSSSIKNSNNVISSELARSITIQPYKFSSNIMTCLGEPYKADFSSIDPCEADIFQTLGFIVNGYCFEVISLDNDHTIMTEMRHLNDGTTLILIDLPWSTRKNNTIRRYEYKNRTEAVGNRYPIIGAYRFMAMTFVSADGTPICMHDAFDYDQNCGSIIPVKGESEYKYTDPELGEEQVDEDPFDTPCCNCTCNK